MQNKRTYILLGVIVLLVAIAAFVGGSNGEVHNVQQAVDEGTLDDLTTDTFLTVWGRRSGDRVVADVLFYSNPQMMKKPGM